MSNTICAGCGKPGAVATAMTDHHYQESGLNVWLRGGVTSFHCPMCKEDYIQVEKEGQLLQVIAVALLTKHGPLTGPQMKYLRGACEMTQQDLAALLKLRRATVADREGKEDPRMSKADQVYFRLMLLQSFEDHLRQEGNDFLANGHKERLAGFTSTFCEMVFREVQEGRFDFGELTVHMDAAREEWRLPIAA